MEASRQMAQDRTAHTPGLVDPGALLDALLEPLHLQGRLKIDSVQRTSLDESRAWM